MQLFFIQVPLSFTLEVLLEMFILYVSHGILILMKIFFTSFWTQNKFEFPCPNSIERALARARLSENTKLENLLPFLATTGSAAPFIGLFGTVWGIMEAFLSIAAQGSAELGEVSQPIAEALVTTALALASAVPAVVAYNYFQRRLKVLNAEMSNFSNDFMNIVKRHFF